MAQPFAMVIFYELHYFFMHSFLVNRDNIKHASDLLGASGYPLNKTEANISTVKS